MGRKKTPNTGVEDHNGPAVAGSKKDKKKGAQLVDDDEYMVVEDEESVNSDVSALVANGKQEAITPQVEEELNVSFEDLGVSLRRKDKKKNEELVPEVSVLLLAGKTGAKGKKGGRRAEDDDDIEFGINGGSAPSHGLSIGQQREEVSGEEDELTAFSGKKKKGKGRNKKGKDQSDDFEATMSVASETSLLESVNDIDGRAEEDEANLFTGKKKGKGKSKKGRDQSDDFETISAIAYETASLESVIDTGERAEEDLFDCKKKGKGKSKKGKDQADEFQATVSVTSDTSLVESANDTVDRTDEDEASLFFGNKKGKGSNKKGKDQRDDLEPTISGVSEVSQSVNDTGSRAIEGEEEEEARILAGTKKGKENSNKIKGIHMLLEEDCEAVSAEMDGSLVPAADHTAEKEILEDGDEETLHFTGKKKKKSGQKKASPFFMDEDMEAVLADTEGTSEVAEVTVLPPSTEGEKSEAEEEETIQFAGKKKGKKTKKDRKVVKTGEDDEIDTLMAELKGPTIVKDLGSAPQPEVSTTAIMDAVAAPKTVLPESTAASKAKQKKKAKKSGRTAQEEEDLDAILAELDGPTRAAPVAAESLPTTVALAVEEIGAAAVESTPAPSEVAAVAAPEAEEVESAASKKKKKKKEKEKAKAATGEKAGEETVVEEKEPVKQEERKGKTVDKKVSKQVREMQERLARMKEAEEKRLREEEEKRLKEEEEQKRLEELEWQKEEAKRKRKEREKEKLLQKKKEGKLLTGKKKEEARRLALMREQFGFHADGDVSGVVEEGIVIPRKPKYENKKKRRPAGSAPSDEAGTTSVLEEVDVEDPVEVEPMVEPEPEPEILPEALVEVEEDEEEDWDAKSWEQGVNLPAIRSAFAEEEADDGPVKVGQIISPSISASAASVRPASPKKKAAPASKRPLLKVVESEEEEDTGSDEETDSDEDDSETKKRREARQKREARRAEALQKRSVDDLRSPICCILGHVDTGKTKLLDCIRRTNVQEGEAGGITQQIGATYFPMENIRERTKELKADAKLRVPGLLVIDTPGHESFTNLRARGSSLCDIAILVVDIMHGLEPQTIESLNLLKARHTPFVVALNKVDRLYGWKTSLNAPIRSALKVQSKDVISEFDMRTSKIITELKERGLNSELYYKNKELRTYVSIIPTSAISGEGVPDILMLLVQLTQKMMEDKLMFISEVQCTVLEVKVVEGLGTTIDVVLVNGVLHEGDQIVVCGMQGPIVTSIRALLTPHPMKELRVKGSYQHHKELKAAQGIKLTGQGLEHAIAGTQLYVVGPEDDLEDVKDEAMQDMKNVMSRVDKSGEGVCVQASTLGSLEALLEFLKSPAVKIPVSGISIGPVHKKDVMRASVMLERKRKEYATILAFDVKVTPEAKELADEVGVRIFTADIIYHLFDQFTAYINSVKEEKRKDASEEAVFPCVLKIMPLYVFNKKDPIVVGVDVLEGVAKVGTPLCVPSREGIDIGRIASMEVSHKVVDTAKKGQTVAIKIVGTNAEETQKMFGRHFDLEDELVSRITRRSIDLLKENYRDDLTTEEWKLVVKLKKLFDIP